MQRVTNDHPAKIALDKLSKYADELGISIQLPEDQNMLVFYREEEFYLVDMEAIKWPVTVFPSSERHALVSKEEWDSYYSSLGRDMKTMDKESL
jgi:hypothetical protein